MNGMMPALQTKRPQPSVTSTELRPNQTHEVVVMRKAAFVLTVIAGVFDLAFCALVFLVAWGVK